MMSAHGSMYPACLPPSPPLTHHLRVTDEENEDSDAERLSALSGS